MLTPGAGVVDSVVQLMSSLPVTVNEIAVEVDVAADAANVTVGGRLLVWYVAFVASYLATASANETSLL